MAKFSWNWGFGNKPEPIKHEVEHIPTVKFREKLRVILELDVEFPVDDSEFYKLLSEEGVIQFKLPDRAEVFSVKLEQVEVLAQATTRK